MNSYSQTQVTVDHTKATATHSDHGMRGLNFLWLEITSKCNLECIHCYANSSPKTELLGRMTTFAWQQVIADAAQNGCKAIQFIGGEPTLHPDFENLVISARNEGINFIEVFTNATTLNKSRATFFRANNIHVAASFYSCFEALHERITKRAGSFNKTVAGIKLALEFEIPIRVGVILIPGINDDHSDKTFEFLSRIGVENIGSDHLREVGRGQCSAPNNQMDQLCGHCWRRRLCITASGDTYPCVFSRAFLVGNVLSSLQKILA